MKALRRRERIGAILFVCLGNICRSPYAERALEREVSGLDDPPKSLSAGFVGPDRPSPPPAHAAADERGLDLSDHRSRRLTGEMLDEADVVFVMDALQHRAIRRRSGQDDVYMLGDLDPVWSGRRAIRDPVDQPLDVFRDVYDRLDRCVKELSLTLSAVREP